MIRFLPVLAFFLAALGPAHAVEPDAQIIKVQSVSSDYRVSQLEEQVRQLFGRIEELNFQLLEMQEVVRRLRQDNEFRFQQLENGAGGFNPGAGNESGSDDDGFIRLDEQNPSDEQGEPTQPDINDLLKENSKTDDGVEIYAGDSGVDNNASGTLGAIRFDQQGNVIETSIGRPLDLTTSLRTPGTFVSRSSLPQDPESLFEVGYENIQVGRYEDAELALVEFSERYSSHPRLPEAQFWLGESYLGRGKYRSAAEVYLKAHKRWPDGKFGPHSLLKLGVSIAGLNQRELACATYAEVLEKYPEASRAVRRNVADEQRAARCAIN